MARWKGISISNRSVSVSRPQLLYLSQKQQKTGQETKAPCVQKVLASGLKLNRSIVIAIIHAPAMFQPAS